MESLICSHVCQASEAERILEQEEEKSEICGVGVGGGRSGGGDTGRIDEEVKNPWYFS